MPGVRPSARSASWTAGRAQYDQALATHPRIRRSAIGSQALCVISQDQEPSSILPSVSIRMGYDIPGSIFPSIQYGWWRAKVTAGGPPDGRSPEDLIGVGAGADQLEPAEDLACDSDRMNKARRQTPTDFRAALRPALGTITPAIHRQTASSATASSEEFGRSLHHSFTWFLSAEREIRPNPAIRLGNPSCTIWTG